MKDKLKEKLGFHKKGFELMAMVHKTDSSTIPLAMLSAVVEAIYPYIGLFFSAAIIDHLLSKEFKTAIFLTILMISSDFLVGLLVDLLKQICDYKSKESLNNMKILIRKKAFELDYETMEKADVLQKISSSEFTMNMYGGVGYLIIKYKEMLGALLSAITAIVLVINLCISKPLKTAAFMKLASLPFSIISFIIFFVFLFMITNKKNLYYGKKQETNFNSHIKAEQQIQYMVMDVFFDYTKGKYIRIFGMKEMLLDIFDYWKKPTRKVYENMCEYEKNSLLLDSIIGGVFTIYTYMLVLIKILAGAVSVGSFTKYTGAFSQFNQSIMDMQSKNTEIRKICSYLSSFIDFMKLENKRETGTIPIEKRLDNEYEIEFHDVSFSYPGSSEKVLDRVSCKVTLKDKIAVVGCNGAGKTTFIKLLCRLYDPTEGVITLNGIDIKKYDYESYIKLFGVVFQDFSLFAFPIRENIAASKELDEGKIWDSLQKAGIKERIEAMPMKLSTPLYKYDEGGMEVSGGEAQKLAIARAIYKDAPFVVLDEPTAALDPISEYEIYSRFDELVKDKTSIYISHRMSSCRFCDDIIVFEHGKIIERGSHEQLMEEDGAYSNLWNAQAQYYT